LANDIIDFVPLLLPSQKESKCVAYSAICKFLLRPANLPNLDQFAGKIINSRPCSFANCSPSASTPLAPPETISKKAFSSND